MHSIVLLLLVSLGVVVVVGAFRYRFLGDGSSKRAALLAELGLPAEQGNRSRETRIAGFFHPYCNAGGGGERVLWTAIAYFQREEPNVVNVVYTGDQGVTKDEIIAKVKQRFGITLNPQTLSFVFLRGRWLVEDSTWPRFTLLGQSVGSMLLAAEALQALVPDVFLETMGYAFTYPVVRFLTAGLQPTPIPILAYIHYPTISSSMLKRVTSRRTDYANSGTISRSAVLSYGKLMYYRIFASIYTACLRASHATLTVNSSWTQAHVDSLLAAPPSRLPPPLSFVFAGFADPSAGVSPPPSRTRRIYPPCDTRSLIQLPLEGRQQIILSLAQFRPEKNQAAQIQAFSLLLKQYPQYSEGPKRARLVLAGSVRDGGDARRVEDLKTLAASLGIQDHVQFVINASYSEIVKWLGRSSVGFSTMVEEHFGINVVEFMAAGLIPVVHASGGPLMDIVTPLDGLPTGFHADAPATFATALHSALELRETPDQELSMRKRAREGSLRFEERVFEEGWKDSWADATASSATLSRRKDA